MYRQGDLLFTKIDALPEMQWNITPEKNGVILKGESGHTHKLEAGKVYKTWGKTYLVLDIASRVVHEEHAPIDLESGIYQVVRQREYIAPNETQFIND